MEKLLVIMLIIALSIFITYKRFMPKIEFMLTYNNDKIVKIELLLWYNSYDEYRYYQRESKTILTIKL